MQTGKAVCVLKDDEKANRYTRNRATFHCCEDLLLSDGILWDPRSRTIVHKFDKLNPHNSGLFHPRGLELLINTEVVRLGGPTLVVRISKANCFSARRALLF